MFFTWPGGLVPAPLFCHVAYTSEPLPTHCGRMHSTVLPSSWWSAGPYMNTFELPPNPLENASIRTNAPEGLSRDYGGNTLLCVGMYRYV